MSVLLYNIVRMTMLEAAPPRRSDRADQLHRCAVPAGDGGARDAFPNLVVNPLRPDRAEPRVAQATTEGGRPEE